MTSYEIRKIAVEKNILVTDNVMKAVDNNKAVMQTTFLAEIAAQLAEANELKRFEMEAQGMIP